MNRCVICLTDFQSGDVVKSLKPCDHEFHKDCIDEWLKVSLKIDNNYMDFI